MIKTWKQAEKISGWSRWTLKRRAKETGNPLPVSKSKEVKQGRVLFDPKVLLNWLKDVRLL